MHLFKKDQILSCIQKAGKTETLREIREKTNLKGAKSSTTGYDAKGSDLDMQSTDENSLLKGAKIKQ
jgi:hypothetical protein